MTDQAQRILPAELEFRFLRDHAKAEAEAIAQRAKSTLAMYSPIPEAAMADVVTRLQEAMRLLEAADHYETLRVQAINESRNA